MDKMTWTDLKLKSIEWYLGGIFIYSVSYQKEIARCHRLQKYLMSRKKRK